VKQLQLLTHANFDVMGKKFLFLGISAVALAISFFFLFTRGLNYGIDFRGGTEVRVKFLSDPAVERVRKDLEALNLGDVNIQSIGKAEERELLIRIGQKSGVKAEGGLIGSGDISERVLSAIRPEKDRQLAASGKINLNEASAGSLETWLVSRVEEGRRSGRISGSTALDPRAAAEAIVAARDSRGGIFHTLDAIRGVPGVTGEILSLLREGAFLGDVAPRSMEFVGPSAGQELIRKATWAVIGSNIGILIYIWIRFRFIWGVAGVIALLHDVVIAMGALAFTQKEFSLPVVAALLTIVGYSINDTVVVFDRIRENLRIHRGKDYEMVVNASINQTFSRTILTVFTVVLCVTTLYLYGGDRLDALSFTLLVGFLSGAYSSILVASPILVLHEQWWQSRRRKRA
jgi:preprotein translocase subunit SecF